MQADADDERRHWRVHAARLNDNSLNDGLRTRAGFSRAEVGRAAPPALRCDCGDRDSGADPVPALSGWAKLWRAYGAGRFVAGVWRSGNYAYCLQGMVLPLASLQVPVCVVPWPWVAVVEPW